MSYELQKVGRLSQSAFLLVCHYRHPDYRSVTVQAQTAAGSVSGQISDPSGAVLPDTPVSLTNTRTGISLDTKTNSSGSYQFLSVPSGSYLLTVKHDGFVQIERNFDLAIQQAGRIDLQMALSGATQTVDVSGDEYRVGDGDLQPGTGGKRPVTSLACLSLDAIP